MSVPASGLMLMLKDRLDRHWGRTLVRRTPGVGWLQRSAHEIQACLLNGVDRLDRRRERRAGAAPRRAMRRSDLAWKQVGRDLGVREGLRASWQATNESRNAGDIAIHVAGPGTEGPVPDDFGERVAR